MLCLKGKMEWLKERCAEPHAAAAATKMQALTRCFLWRKVRQLPPHCVSHGQPHHTHTRAHAHIHTHTQSQSHPRHSGTKRRRGETPPQDGPPGKRARRPERHGRAGTEVS